MKSISKFKGISKEQKKKLINQYLKIEWKNINLSYVFIALSSSCPIISCMNGAIYVAVWYSISVLLSIWLYVNQSDYMMQNKRERHYSKKHKEKVAKRSIFTSEIGGWDAIATQVFVAIVFCILEVLISLYLQKRNMYVYQSIYRGFFEGILADTYIVSFCNVVIGIYRDYIYNCVNSGTKLKEIILKSNLKTKFLNICTVILLILACRYYIENEFKGLLGDKIMAKYIVSGIYILFMMWPLLIIELKHVWRSLKRLLFVKSESRKI